MCRSCWFQAFCFPVVAQSLHHGPDCWIFWEMTSRTFSVLCTLWFDSGSWTRCACTSLCNDRCRSSAVAVLTGVDTPVFAQWFIPMVLTIEISSYSLTRWSSSLLCRLCGALRCRVVVKVSLLPVLTFMHGSTLSR